MRQESERNEWMLRYGVMIELYIQSYSIIQMRLNAVIKKKTDFIDKSSQFNCCCLSIKFRLFFFYFLFLRIWSGGHTSVLMKPSVQQGRGFRSGSLSSAGVWAASFAALCTAASAFRAKAGPRGMSFPATRGLYPPGIPPVKSKLIPFCNFPVPHL